MIGNLFATTAMKVSAAIIAALLLACILLWIGWSNEERNVRAAEQRFAVSEANHAVTLASLESLSEQMEGLVADGELRKERLTSAMMQARQDADELRQEADAIAREAPRDDCATPRRIMEARGL